jgi:two-component sensor histidine kinase
MHHRVKNNLQQIASLIRLQTRFSKYTTTEQALSDSLNRILAIAAVHELLSRDDLDSVSIRKVTEQILTATKQSVVAPDKRLTTRVDGPDIRLPLNHATSIALVINELVQNLVRGGLGGTFTMENHDGILATVRFPK